MLEIGDLVADVIDFALHHGDLFVLIIHTLTLVTKPIGRSVELLLMERDEMHFQRLDNRIDVVLEGIRLRLHHRRHLRLQLIMLDEQQMLVSVQTLLDIVRNLSDCLLLGGSLVDVGVRDVGVGDVRVGDVRSHIDVGVVGDDLDVRDSGGRIGHGDHRGRIGHGDHRGRGGHGDHGVRVTHGDHGVRVGVGDVGAALLVVAALLGAWHGVATKLTLLGAWHGVATKLS
ncbi:hypothetical protein HDV62DRAFT_355097 [Trichoderma sp. SZMC 28011]